MTILALSDDKQTYRVSGFGDFWLSDPPHKGEPPDSKQDLVAWFKRGKEMVWREIYSPSYFKVKCMRGYTESVADNDQRVLDYQALLEKQREAYKYR